MVSATITNIILEGDRFRVFILLNIGIQENQIFMPDATSDTIRTWVSERVMYYTEMQRKADQLTEELTGTIIGG